MEDRKGRNAGMQGVGFKDEFHSRIKFNRRGLLGMANEGPDSNGSQFFITLGEAPELQGKNTCFGRVQGDTIYNVARMGEAEVEDGERPVYPTRVTGVEVLVNPFKDMVVRARVAPVMEKQKQPEKKKRKKGGKQLLSFGDEEGEDAAPVPKKAKFDIRIVVDEKDPEPALKLESKPKAVAKRKETRPKSEEPTPEPTPPPEALPTRTAPPARDASSSPEPVQKVTTLLDRTNAQIAELKASMKRNIPKPAAPEKKKSILEQMIPATSVRGRKRTAAGKSTAESDRMALDMLARFRTKLEQAPPEREVSKATPPPEEKQNGKAEQVEEEEEATLCDLHFIASCQSCKSWDAYGEREIEDDDNDKGWMSHALTFEKDKLGKDLSFKKKAEEELVVIDPREKARTLKEEKKAGREARSAGGGRQWDQARNEKLARASALAGRGAR